MAGGREPLLYRAKPQRELPHLLSQRVVRTSLQSYPLLGLVVPIDAHPVSDGVGCGRERAGGAKHRLALLRLLAPSPSRDRANGLQDRPRLGDRAAPAKAGAKVRAVVQRAARARGAWAGPHLRAMVRLTSTCHVTSERNSIAVSELMLTSTCTASVGSSTAIW